MKAVILAGGKGTRLKPYTTAFPKPLMPIGNRPVLEIIIRQLKARGFEDIIMLVGYLDGLIRAYFEDGSRFGVNISYSKEDKPMGTVGGLSLIKQQLDDNFFIINGDTLTTLDFSDIAREHKAHKSAATIMLKKRQIVVDFGVVDISNGNQIKGYTEKPTFTNLVSTGVSVLSPEVLQYVDQAYLDFPVLVQRLISAGKEVRGYVFDGYWLDIGRPDDYEKANAEIEEITDKLGIITDDAPK